MLTTVCRKESNSAMFQQEGEGSIYWRKLARVLPIFLEKNRSHLGLATIYSFVYVQRTVSSQ